MDEEDFNSNERVLQLLQQWQTGDRTALAELTPIVYRELLRLANHYMSGGHCGHMLKATALVNEAFTRLIRKPASTADSKHFLAATAKLMRQMLVDHAKARSAREFGNGIDIVEVDEALSRLQTEHPDAAHVVELQYFGGLGQSEIAAILEVSTSTVKRQIRFAKAWLFKYLQV